MAIRHTVAYGQKETQIVTNVLAPVSIFSSLDNVTKLYYTIFEPTISRVRSV